MTWRRQAVWGQRWSYCPYRPLSMPGCLNTGNAITVWSLVGQYALGRNHSSQSG
jgi:hypothetical protein